LCKALNLTARTIQRWQSSLTSEDLRRGPKTHSKALSDGERAEVINVLSSNTYVDETPHTVVAKLADKSIYLCSPSTMYRLLRKRNLLAHRGRGKVPEYGNRIETAATEPNQVWCWDITYLPSITKGRSFKLYMIEDLFSRKIVGFRIHDREDEKLATAMFSQALVDEKIKGEKLRVHSDNGHPMKTTTFVEKMKSLGVLPSCSRPRVSNDNAFIETLFKTMKYRPNYPCRPFIDITEAKTWAVAFVRWYNTVHMHSGIGYVTPDQRHDREDIAILDKRRALFERARQRRPERWSRWSNKWLVEARVELNAAGCRMIK